MDGEVARGATTRDAHIYVKDNQHRIHATFADTHPCPACLHECITQVLASVALLRDVAPNEVDSHATKGTCARQSGGSVWRGQPDDRRWADGARLAGSRKCNAHVAYGYEKCVRAHGQQALCVHPRRGPAPPTPACQNVATSRAPS